jgi:hypothetical protein
MKKSLLLGILGLTATTVSSFGQGVIYLDNYVSSSHPPVVYGAGVPNAIPGAAVTTNVLAGGPYTVGLYFVNQSGNYVSDFNSDPSGFADPTMLYSGPGMLLLGGGPGSTGEIGVQFDVAHIPGEYEATGSFNPGLGGDVTMTMMIIAYNGSSYANATVRGHSTAFTITTVVGLPPPSYTGDFETDGGFAVYSVPEPSVFALSGIGTAALMLTRRKKSNPRNG